MTRFVVFGAGSIGCYAGGRLAAGGADVALIGREKLAATIGQHGLTITDHEGADLRVPAGSVRFETDPAALRDADVVLVCVKSMATEEAAVAIAAYAPESALVISLQNGVANADTLREGLPGRAVAAGMVPYNVVNLGAGKFHRGTPGGLIVEDLPQARAVAEEMNRADLLTELHDNIEGVLWGKVLINLNNAINMLSDQPLRTELLDISYRRVWALAIREGLTVLKAAGIKPEKSGPLDPALFVHILRLPNFLLLRIARAFSKVDEKARSSMWEDLQAGRQPEVDYINGAIVELGHEVGVATPVNETIIGLVKEAFAAGRSPALTGAELLARVRGQCAR